MRRGNLLPDGGNDKVKENRIETYSDTWWRRITATLLGVSFGTYRKRCKGVLMGRRG